MSGKKAKVPRKVCQLKHPRFYDRLHGLDQVEDLFENLTPKGWVMPKQPKDREGE